MKRFLIYIAGLAGAAVFVSYRGGNIPYLLFYFMLLLPVLALGYSLYVYWRFKIVQEVQRTVVKAQRVPYRLILANEDPIPLMKITLNYFTEKVTLKENADAESGEIQATNRFCILAHEKLRVDTEMYCKYRGTFPVGVKSVSITDFLGLFTITYPMKGQIRLTARPRIIPLERLFVDLQKADPKNNSFSAAKQQELPDFELRRYRPGDPLKYVHWKNSAKAGELLVRKTMPEELFETVIIMDLSPVGCEGEKRFQTEDNIIEAAVSFVHHYYMKKIPVRVVYMEDRIKDAVIDVRTGFEGFYNKCSELAFQATLGLEQVWEEYARRAAGGCAYILITAAVTDSMLLKIEDNIRGGGETLLINTGELAL